MEDLLLRRTYIFALFSALIVNIPLLAAEKEVCVERLTFQGVTSELFQVNGIPVTGEATYPVEVVVRHLGLDVEKIHTAGLSVLSIGEGLSELLPVMLRAGIKAQAVDIWYHRTAPDGHPIGHMMNLYNKYYGPFLINSDGRQIPLPDESIDIVVSHQLLRFFYLKEKLPFISEAIRVARRESRLFGISSLEVEPVREFLSARFPKAKASFIPVSSSWPMKEGRLKLFSNLVVVEK